MAKTEKTNKAYQGYSIDFRYEIQENRRRIKRNKTLQKVMKIQNKNDSKYTKKERKLISNAMRNANKRLDRLNKLMVQNKLFSGAVTGRIDPRTGKLEHFSIKGKSDKEIAQELLKLKQFEKSVTSTVRGSMQYTKDKAKEKGLSVKEFSKRMNDSKREIAETNEVDSIQPYNQLDMKVSFYSEQNYTIDDNFKTVKTRS